MELQTINEINPKDGEVIYCPSNKRHYLKLTTGDIVCMNDKLHTSEQTVLKDSGNWRGWVLITPRDTATLQIEVGKYYRTRDGRKVGPMEGFGRYRVHTADSEDSWQLDGTYDSRNEDGFDLIAEWTETPADDTPKTWGEMTDAEKGALLLADHEGKLIEWTHPGWQSPLWHISSMGTGPHEDKAYRIKPEPVVETVTLYGSYDNGQWVFGQFDDGVHSVVQTFTTTDGKPDLDSVKMEEV